MPQDDQNEILRTLRQIARWVRNFNIDGPNVSAKNTPSGFSAYIWSPKVTASGGGSDNGAIVKVTATAAGNHQYTGYVWNPPAADINSASNLTEAMVGSQGTAIQIVHLRGIGTSSPGWFIDPAGADVLFHARRVYTNSDGTPVYAIDSDQGNPCA